MSDKTDGKVNKAEYPLNSLGMGYRSTLDNSPYMLEDINYNDPIDNNRYQFCGACVFYSNGNCTALNGSVSILGSCRLHIDMARELSLRFEAYRLRIEAMDSNSPNSTEPARVTASIVEDDEFELVELVDKYIVQENGKYCVRSHKTGKNLGCYDSKAEAEKRLHQLERFRKSDDKTIEVKIAATNEEKQIVWGVVLEPDEVDSQDDTITVAEIEKAAHNYALTPMVIGDSHVKKAKAKPVETFVYDPEILEKVKPGSWVMAVKVQDKEIWKGIKEGKFTGFSIGAIVHRVTLDTPIEDSEE